MKKGGVGITVSAVQYNTIQNDRLVPYSYYFPLWLLTLRSRDETLMTIIGNREQGTIPSLYGSGSSVAILPTDRNKTSNSGLPSQSKSLPGPELCVVLLYVLDDQ